jgi:outer membrane biosynthesis protein TonB
VDADGQVAFLVLEKSTGDPTIDRELLRLLRGLRFLTAEKSGIVWDFLEFQWGSGPNPQKTP